ncbi:MAG: ABC transporter permease [Planctomycetes bacterium]|nr:ABC transporter permease [Planctomycetota bacterium]
MTVPVDPSCRTEPDDLAPRGAVGGPVRAQASARWAARVLFVLVALAVYAPWLAGDRPLVVRARLPGHVEAHRKRLARAYPYDLRHGLPGVDGHVERELVALGALVGEPAASRLEVRLAEWRALGARPGDAEPRLVFLAAVEAELVSAVPRRRTLFPAAASLGWVEVLLAGLFPGALLVLAARRRPGCARVGLGAGLALGVVLFCRTAPTVPGLDSPAALAAIQAADPEATLIRPPVPFGPDHGDPAARLRAPGSVGPSGARHWLGTDDLGRDLVAMLVWGARTSLLVGVASVALLLVIGIVAGATAGYFRGPVDLVVSRAIEVFQAFPSLVLVLAAVAFLRSGLGVVILVIGCTRWTTAARLVRGEFLRLGRADFVLAARALGFSAPRIIIRHMLPGVLPPVLVHAVFAVAAAILVESSLAFLGLGDPSAASWGQVIDRGRYVLGAWWVTAFPGAVLFGTILALRVLGEGLRSGAGSRAPS